MGLHEVLAAGLQGASTVGTELLGRPVELSLRQVHQGGWDLAGSLKGFSLACPVNFSQDLSGGAVVLMDARQAALMGELMLGNESAEVPPELTDAQRGAAAEVLSQMIGALGEGFSRALRRKILATAGELKVVAGDGAAAARGAVKEDRVVIADCELKIGSFPPARFASVLSGSQAEVLAAERPGAAGPDVTLGPPQPAAGGAQVRPVHFGTVQAPPAAEGAPIANLDLLLDVPLEMTVELGRATRKVREVLALGPGSIVELNKLAGEPVDILVNGKLIAKGEVVVIDENFAVRIIEIVSREERLSGGL